MSRTRFWRSLDELAGDEELLAALHREFPENAAELLDPVSRRRFLELMGASLALAGATACVRQPAERIVPYVRQPEELVPGKPLYYASAAPRFGAAHGILVESHMGRPTKIEGNPVHPASLGATDAVVQAEILSLYDPDRSQVVLRGGRITTWEAFLATFAALISEHERRGGAGFRLLTPAVTSPTLARQLQLLQQRLPEARFHAFDAAGRDNLRRGSLRAFGEYVDTCYRLDRADVIVALDADFLTAMPGSVRYARDFADRRRVRAGRLEMNRLYAFECTPSPTGAMADHRWPVRPSGIEAVARAIGSRLGLAGGAPALPEGIGEAWIDALAEDLRARPGRSLLIAGDAQPPAVHALAHAINAQLGNAGETVVYIDPVAAAPVDQLASLTDLVAAMGAGQVGALGILGCNPVFDAPADLDFTAALASVPVRFHLGLYRDETAEHCHWHVPEAHLLEAWGDLRAWDGTAAVIQPLIEPLYDGHSVHELLAALLGQPERDGYDIVRATWQEAWEAGGLASAGSASADAAPAGAPVAGRTTGAPGVRAAAGPGNDFEAFWKRSIHDGVIPGSEAIPRDAALRADWDLDPGGLPEEGSPAEVAAGRDPGGAAGGSEPAAGQAGGAESAAGQAEGAAVEVLFRPDPTIHDGRHANNGWLQELPKPLTLLTWSNAALLAPATAERLGLANEQNVSIEVAGRSVVAPVWILPGQPDGAVTLHFGYGRRRTGRVGTGTGFDAYPLRTTAGFWDAPGLVRRAGGRTRLATTQHHHSMEGRDLVRVGTLEELRATGGIDVPGGHGHPPGPAESLHPPWSYEGYSWAMQIDLNVCIGCNGCMTACQAENNVPVVGEQQVRAGREMHWLRVDRYWADRLDNPETFFQPLPCMHCENAPCEVVCPVAATVHGDEGLNEMIYNRCVGTRYCANNCPYKVRRFNFLAYADAEGGGVRQLGRNPDVTVRSRGVMEKCTYCVQRINEARITAKNEWRPIRDGEVVPACAQACPTRAISFGDINDPDSEVSRLRAEPLHYGILAELGTRPRTNYLARLRNPNPAIAGDPAAAAVARAADSVEADADAAVARDTDPADTAVAPALADPRGLP
jgi:molybdopterin-containing oxidoreductase family iron-sulfur binding subunit